MPTRDWFSELNFDPDEVAALEEDVRLGYRSIASQRGR